MSMIISVVYYPVIQPLIRLSLAVNSLTMDDAVEIEMLTYVKSILPSYRSPPTSGQVFGLSLDPYLHSLSFIYSSSQLSHPSHLNN